MEQTNIIHQGDEQNNVKVHAPVDMTNYNMSRPFLYTQRFGQLALCYAETGEPKDKVYVGNADSVESYTLAAPLKSNVYHKKDYFQVPYKAIIPINWDKYYQQPKMGDDVTDETGTTVKGFPQLVEGYMAYRIMDMDSTDRAAFWRWLVEMGYFYSYGSLLASAGYSMERMVVFMIDGENYYYDDLFEKILTGAIEELGSGSFSITYNGETINVYANKVPDRKEYTDPKSISIRRFLELVHDNPIGLTAVTTEPTDYKNYLDEIITTLKNSRNIAWHGTNAPCDLATLHAYQMVCTHYYSNDNVDNLYSANLYRQNLKGVISKAFNNSGDDWTYNMTFNYNGVLTEYDAASAYAFKLMLTMFSTYEEAEAMISIIFAWRNSLRYMDYFTGSRVSPLSVGNIDVAVNMGTGTVNVLEIVETTMKTRYYNAVNRSGRKEANYLEEIYNIRPDHDMHDPIWLGHIQDTIYCTETENTGDAQLTEDAQGNRTGMAYAITGQLKGSNGERYVFEVDVKEKSILIGIGYFDIERVYTHATRRTLFHENRFEMFNPFMQTIGDQKIYQSEITDIPISVNIWDAAFSYEQRHGEYKNSFGRAVGGFASGALKQWAFVDNEIDRGEEMNLNEAFVRSSCVELDRYYLTLTNYSIANYFHFIIVSYNRAEMVRNMIMSPNIL